MVLRILRRTENYITHTRFRNAVKCRFVQTQMKQMCNSLQKAKYYNPACRWTMSTIQCQILCPTLFNNQWLDICNIYGTFCYGIHSIKFKPLHIMFYRELIMFRISQLLLMRCYTAFNQTRQETVRSGTHVKKCSFFFSICAINHFSISKNLSFKCGDYIDWFYI